jgi:hypothetical protein
MGLSPQFKTRAHCGDPKRLSPIGGRLPISFCAFCLVGADPINFANAQQITVIKAEAALSAKIRCEDFRKNSDGTWTSGPNTKIHTQGVSIGGADLATVLNRKCGG